MGNWRDRQGNKQGGAISVNTNLSRSTFTEEYTSDTGGDIGPLVLITPTLGKKLSIYDVEVNSEGNSGDVRAELLTSSIIVEVAYLAKSVQQNRNDLHIVGAIDEVLTLTADGIGNAQRLFITVNYEEV